MDYTLPQELTDFLARLDAFIAAEIDPLQAEHEQYFDHRREWARTDWEHDGVPRAEWLELLAEMRRRADHAGFYRYALPKAMGGSGGTNLGMAVIRDHLAARGLGLANELQSESAVVGNLVFPLIFDAFGTPEQKEQFVAASITGEARFTFALTEPAHGSDATWMDTRAERDGDDWVITGAKRFASAIDEATHVIVFARTSGDPGSGRGVTAFVVERDAPGVDVPFYHWTFNMPTDHGELTLDRVRVPHSAILGEEGRAFDTALYFVHENRIRQAASGVGAADYCVRESVAYARERIAFGKPLSERQAIQWPLVELHTDVELVRTLVRKVAHEMDDGGKVHGISDRVSMCNLRANRLVCDAADRAMQVHGGIGYTRGKPFEHIYRHHRRYRITEGTEEIQIRNIAGHLFGFIAR
ncbi:acyl-CoA dehydrogenase family protein [Solirubrobacter ginsenosidimutans]|uniref:Acyl-CoA dehydrogenase family protein n=1 Tax=Solirubrobacter ginsenosidimutans TaxID=490573 RepID=A0A9X3RZL4_9ACTN|nr:acyl-CoA dehydrogenase family protein [Solirubrobacter ginsenosidimutans]MDA0160334.1 acyl-CoA dehydrogenase family protein [Solirubrobacter ginsenosidimutans]